MAKGGEFGRHTSEGPFASFRFVISSLPKADRIGVLSGLISRDNTPARGVVAGQTQAPLIFRMAC